MPSLALWFRFVGGFYLLLGLGFLPPLNAARAPLVLPGLEHLGDGPLARGFLDFSLMLGLDFLVLGLFLLWASARPGEHRSLAWLVLWLELARGILDDLYMILRGYPTPFYLGFILLHLIVVITGLAALRRGPGRRGAVRKEAP